MIWAESVTVVMPQRISPQSAPREQYALAMLQDQSIQTLIGAGNDSELSNPSDNIRNLGGAAYRDRAV
jgi:hypothetical protein